MASSKRNSDSIAGPAWRSLPHGPCSSGSRRNTPHPTPPHPLQPRGHSHGPRRGANTHLDIFLRFLSSALAFWADVRLSASARLSTAIARKTLRRMSTGQLRRPELQVEGSFWGRSFACLCVFRPEPLRGQFLARPKPLGKSTGPETRQVLGEASGQNTFLSFKLEGTLVPPCLPLSFWTRLLYHLLFLCSALGFFPAALGTPISQPFVPSTLQHFWVERIILLRLQLPLLCPISPTPSAWEPEGLTACYMGSPDPPFL